jgi:hypothetical protein
MEITQEEKSSGENLPKSSLEDIVSAGHVLTFTNTETIVSDIGGAYILRIPRIPDSRELRVPLHLLQRLTDLRVAHPLHNLQHHNDSA